MAAPLHNLLLDSRVQLPATPPAQRRGAAQEPFQAKQTTPAAVAGRRASPAVHIQLSKEALALLNGDAGAALKPATSKPGNDRSATGARPQRAASDAQDDFAPRASPARAAILARGPYTASSAATMAPLPPGSHLDITL